MKVLVLGASGMLGNTMLRVLAESNAYDVYGTVRSASVCRHFSPALAKRIISGIDVENADMLARLFDEVRPQVVVNCIGLIKQQAAAEDPLQTLPINSVLPHRIARLCALVSARLVHVSTDCVFDGKRGNYRETDLSDAIDLYGKSKHLGEVHYRHTITLRTSIIGRELESKYGLIEWFLAQSTKVKGYRRAVFSGLPTVELSCLVRDFVLQRPELFGLYHVGAAPINKYELLGLVATAWGKTIEIEPEDLVVIDRSLDVSRFREATGYVAPSWPELIARMRKFEQKETFDV